MAARHVQAWREHLVLIHICNVDAEMVSRFHTECTHRDDPGNTIAYKAAYSESLNRTHSKNSILCQYIHIQANATLQFMWHHQQQPGTIEMNTRHTIYVCVVRRFDQAN